jgi:acylglycerol lipase
MDMVAAAYKYWPESKPLLLLHGTADLVTSPKGTEQFYERVNAKDKTLKLYEGYLHDLLQEPGQDKVMVGEYIVDWLNKHI